LCYIERNFLRTTFYQHQFRTSKKDWNQLKVKVSRQLFLSGERTEGERSGEKVWFFRRRSSVVYFTLTYLHPRGIYNIWQTISIIHKIVNKIDWNFYQNNVSTKSRSIIIILRFNLRLFENRVKQVIVI